MTKLNAKRKPIKLIETIFDIAYLSTVFISAILLLASGEAGSLRWQFGLMALVLGVGDSFHLLPRIYDLWNSGTKAHTALLGIGKLVASITMTVFYVILWNIGVTYYEGTAAGYMNVIIYALAALRILLCLFPQNRWTAENPPLNWSIGRNIPFFILGMIVMVLFAAGSHAANGRLPFLWAAILISFACYLPVVLFSGRNPKLGMLMLPKSCAYAAIVLMGFSLGA